MKAVMERLKRRSDVAYLSISIDSDRKTWEKGLESGKYTIPGQIHLFTGGKSHPFLKEYRIGLVPHVILLGKNGKILSFNEEIRQDKGENIVKLIESQR